MQERSDAHGRERALTAARQDPPADVSAAEAVAAVTEVME